MMTVYEKNPIRLVIADDHYIFRKGLSSSLSSSSAITIVGEASNGKELIEIVDQKMPEIVLTDIKMPIINGIEATRIISSKYPKIGVIALSIYDSEELVTEIINAGVSGYLLKNADMLEVINAIIAVSQKKCYYNSIPNTTFTSTKCKMVINPENVLENKFTSLELSVMRLVCNELSNKEMALQLKTTIRSVESAKERLLKKTGSKNMVGIALFALKHNITD